jgi:hypothetical protein
VRTLVPKEVALDAFLVVPAILRVAPRERCVTLDCSQDNLVSGANDEIANSLRLSRTVVASVEVADAQVSVLGKPPKRPITKGSGSINLLLLNRCSTIVRK